jgi:predicted SprT family Zn-dependent metalloprotease
MGEIKETYTRYECDLCGEEINQKHPHTITTKFKIKYLCPECLTVIVHSIGQEDIEYYFKDDN